MESVRVMLSYDYNHFEISLNVPDGASLKDVNERRKDATRLCLEAIRQYRVAKEHESLKSREWEYNQLVGDVDYIKKNFPESERTPAHKAKIKALEDWDFALQHGYDFDDDTADLFR